MMGRRKIKGVKVRVVNCHTRGYFLLRWTDHISGKLKEKISNAKKLREAEREAAELERELQSRVCNVDVVYWKAFRERYLDEKGVLLKSKTVKAFKAAANKIEDIINPNTLVDINTSSIS
jgi:hypothetical protein